MREKCILQVEDEDADIFLLKRVFVRAGIQSPLRAVTDGQMAIDYLLGIGEFADRERFPIPCLVLLDLKLPKLNGLKVLEWIRQQPGMASLVVVVFSSSAEPSDVQRAYQLGANAYIEKPSDMERTLEVAQLLKGWWLLYNRFGYVTETPRDPAPAAQPAPGR